ncbi:MAG: hypothetical protein JNK23_16815 [Opitutaceae bacterium]|nr:hypothetical protein [Opitutaceae bacterium]
MKTMLSCASPHLRLAALAVAVALATPLCSPAAPAPAVPEFKVGSSREKNFGDSPVVIVPTIYLKLPVAGKVSVAKQGSALSGLGSSGGANTVRASAHYVVSGLDKALAQQLAKKVYDDFVARLRAAGYTVKTYADIAELEAVKKVERAKPDAAWGLPVEKDAMGSNALLVATPSDEQSFKPGFGGAVLAPFQKLGKSTLGEGTVLIPTYVITAPQIWGEKGGGYKTISVGINAAPGMNLASANVLLLTQKGAWGDATLKSPAINISEQVGQLAMQDTSPGAANAISSALSVLTGTGKISGKSANYQFTIDPAAFEAGVLLGTGGFHAEAMKIIAAARKP